LPSCDKPEFFCLDEPLANVEPGLRARFRADLARLRREYLTTMIYVTHDHMDAMMVGTRVAVLRQGVLSAGTDPATLYEAPANLFVAGFIGSPP
jgi:multiple sugar transport system ATP-binding protein